MEKRERRDRGSVGFVGLQDGEDRIGLRRVLVHLLPCGDDFLQLRRVGALGDFAQRGRDLLPESVHGEEADTGVVELRRAIVDGSGQPDRIHRDRQQVRHRIGVLHRREILDRVSPILIRTAVDIPRPPHQAVDDLTHRLRKVRIGDALSVVSLLVESRGQKDLLAFEHARSGQHAGQQPGPVLLELGQRRGDDERLGPVAQAAQATEGRGQIVHQPLGPRRFGQVARRQQRADRRVRKTDVAFTALGNQPAGDQFLAHVRRPELSGASRVGDDPIDFGLAEGDGGSRIPLGRPLLLNPPGDRLEHFLRPGQRNPGVVERRQHPGHARLEDIGAALQRMIQTAQPGLVSHLTEQPRTRRQIVQAVDGQPGQQRRFVRPQVRSNLEPVHRLHHEHVRVRESNA